MLMHKYRTLIKPMVVVTTTEYILSIVVPFFADGKNNDAAIVRNMINTNADGINDWLKKGNIFILDRGFGDVLELLEDGGFHTESPASLPKSSKQFSTNVANHSRLVTKIRWAVESIDISKITEDDIRALTSGIYQVRQATSYADEYIHDTTLQIYFRQSMSDRIHARIQSRHTSAKQYDICVEHDGKILKYTGWNCQCPLSARTGGTWSHVASVIWFLAYARHNNYKPKKDRISPLLMDAAEGH